MTTGSTHQGKRQITFSAIISKVRPGLVGRVFSFVPLASRSGSWSGSWAVVSGLVPSSSESLGSLLGAAGGESASRVGESSCGDAVQECGN